MESSVLYLNISSSFSATLHEKDIILVQGTWKFMMSFNEYHSYKM